MKIFSVVRKIPAYICGVVVDDLESSIAIGSNKYQIKSYFKNRVTRNNQDESWLDSALNAALKSKTGAFIDVGANTGQTLIKILSLDDSRQYIGFEPQMDCCFYIEQFINKNHLSNHFLMPIGLSNRNGVINLLKRYENIDTTASTIEGFRPDEFYGSKQAICVAKGDDIISGLEIKDISIIKVDVEGGELEVIDGLKETLSLHKPFVFFEVLNNYLAVTNQTIDSDTIHFRNVRCNELEQILRQLDYTIFNILPDNKLQEIDKIEPLVSRDLKLTDYLAVPNDSRKDFIRNYGGNPKLQQFDASRL